MGRELENIFDECVGRLAGGERVDECVQRYPEYREELVPLLEVAAATMGAASSAVYRPESKARGLSRLTTELAHSGVRKRPWYAMPSWSQIAARPVVLGLVAALVTTGMAVGTGMASSDSVPGEPLYWIKSRTENISLILPQSDMSRAQAHARLANERVREIERLANKGRLDDAERHVKNVRHHLGETADYVNVSTVSNPIEMPVSRSRTTIRYTDADKLRTRLERDMEVFTAQFEEMMKTVPPGMRVRIDILMRNSELHYVSLILALEGSPMQTRQPFSRFGPPRPRDQ